MFRDREPNIGDEGGGLPAQQVCTCSFSSVETLSLLSQIPMLTVLSD